MVQGFGDGGRQRIHIKNVHSLMPLLPLCYSTHKSSFCEEERVQRWPSFSPSSSTGGKTDACQRILIKNTPDVVRRPACFVVKGVQGCGGGFAANIYGAMPEGLLIAGFPRIVSLPQWGRLRGAALCADFCERRCPKVVSSHQPPATRSHSSLLSSYGVQRVQKVLRVQRVQVAASPHVR